MAALLYPAVAAHADARTARVALDAEIAMGLDRDPTGRRS
jgi:hypothetical protein